MGNIENLITNLGFPIALVIGLGIALYKIAILYLKTTAEREKQLMDNNKETLELMQNLALTLEKVNDKLDIIIHQKECEEKQKK